jgi:hypothetical protein
LDDTWREEVQDAKVDVSWDGRRFFSDPDSDLAHMLEAAVQ